MNEDEYAKRYKKSKRQVKTWLEEGRIRGAVFSNEVWDIPREAKVEYYVRKRRNRGVVDNVRDVVKALEGFWYIDEVVLGCTEYDYEYILRILESMGLIVRSDVLKDDITNVGVELTTDGLIAAKKSKMSFVKIYGITIESISKGCFEAVYDADRF